MRARTIFAGRKIFGATQSLFLSNRPFSLSTRQFVRFQLPSSFFPLLFAHARRILAVAGFGILPVHAAQLTIGWDDQSTNESGFKIERSVDGNTFVEIATVEASVTSYIDHNLSPSTTYWYRVRAYNSTATSDYSNITGGTTESAVFTATAFNSSISGSASRLANLSVRAIPGAGEQALIVGFVVGHGTKPILLRAIGPGLAALTTSSILPDPSLTVQSGGLSILSNDNWGGTAQLKTIFTQLGAFPLSDTSQDAALRSDFAPGGYTALVSGAGSGIAMAEIYDADTTASLAGRLVNLSARANVGTGDGVLIAGFVISGNAPMRVLVRGVGPTLAKAGVASALSDPQLDLFRGSLHWDHNDDWAGNAQLAAAFAEVGASPLTDPASKDAALLVTLPPGAYTAIVSGVNGASGVALAEVYELP